MELKDIIGILGVVATIYSIYVVVKKKKYPGQLTVLKENSIGLFNEIANNFSEIKISYLDEPIKNNIIYIKASVFNSGQIDLDLKSSETPVSISLPNSAYWIKSKISNTSPGIECSSEIDFKTNKINIDCGFLRKDEFFQIEALIISDEVEINSYNVFEKIKLEHRLLNTQNTTPSSFLTKKSKSDHRSDLFFAAIPVSFMTIFFSYLFISDYFFKQRAELKFQQGQEIYSMVPLRNKSVELVNDQTDSTFSVTLEQLQQNFSPIIPDTSFYEKNIVEIWLVTIFILATSILLANEVFKYRRSKRIVEQLEKN